MVLLLLWLCMGSSIWVLTTNRLDELIRFISLSSSTGWLLLNLLDLVYEANQPMTARMGSDASTFM